MSDTANDARFSRKDYYNRFWPHNKTEYSSNVQPRISTSHNVADHSHSPLPFDQICRQPYILSDRTLAAPHAFSPAFRRTHARSAHRPENAALSVVSFWCSSRQSAPWLPSIITGACAFRILISSNTHLSTSPTCSVICRMFPPLVSHDTFSMQSYDHVDAYNDVRIYSPPSSVAHLSPPSLSHCPS